MTETPATEPVAADDSHAEEAASPEPQPDRLAAWRGRSVGLALVGVGALVGAVAVVTLRPHPTAATTAAPDVVAQQPAAVPIPPGGDGEGEQRLLGTLAAVGRSTVTIRTSSGTNTYAVTPRTEIVRNGALVPLSALRAGDNVFVHVVPDGTSYAVERLFAQSAGATGTGNGTSTGSQA